MDLNNVLKVQTSSNRLLIYVLKTTETYAELLELFHSRTNLKEWLGGCITGQELQGMARGGRQGAQLPHRW